MPGRRQSKKRSRQVALLEAVTAGAQVLHGHDDRDGVEPSSSRARLVYADPEREVMAARGRLVDPRTADDACKDCAQPRLPGRSDANGAPLNSLCAWCHACRGFDSGTRAPSTFAETQNDGFRDRSKDTMMRILNAPNAAQYQFWTDQIRSKRSYPFGTFSDRASDSLLCSLLAWDPDRATGLRLATDTRPPFDARAPALFEVRAQALEDYIVSNEEEEGWDYEDKERFRVENLFPVDNDFLARRARENRQMMNAVAEELARRERGGWEAEAGAYGAWEGASRDEDGMECVMTECEQQLQCAGWGAEDDDVEDEAMIDEDYAAEHNYHMY